MRLFCEVSICNSCGHVHQGDAPYQCDCLGTEQYTKGYVYTAPAQIVDLSDSEILQLAINSDDLGTGPIGFARSIESKIKNNL